MSKTHYDKLAKVLVSIPTVCLRRDYRRIVTRVSKVLQEENSRFDPTKFFEACGLKVSRGLLPPKQGVLPCTREVRPSV